MIGELETKAERMAKLIGAEKLSGVLLNARHNFSWATGGGSSTINRSAENGCCYLLYAADGRRYLLANNIEMPRLLAEQVPTDFFEPIEIAWPDERNGSFVVDLARKIAGTDKPLASDLFLNSALRPIENLIARCRFELTPEEIVRYRSLGRDAGEVFSRIFDAIEPGESELEIAHKLDFALAARGIETTVTLVGADDRINQFRHPVPTANRWRRTLLIVACAMRDGLFANLSRIACVGEAPDELRHGVRVCAEIFGDFLAATVPGRTGAEIYSSAVDFYGQRNVGAELGNHHQGGATGYKGRDWVAHPACGEVVRNFQAFAWNPSVRGAKAEETVLVTDDGIEFLTESPDFPQIVVQARGREFAAPGILQL